MAWNPLLQPFIYRVPAGLLVIFRILPFFTWASKGHPAEQSLLQLTGMECGFVFNVRLFIYWFFLEGRD